MIQKRLKLLKNNSNLKSKSISKNSTKIFYADKEPLTPVVAAPIISSSLSLNTGFNKIGFSNNFICRADYNQANIPYETDFNGFQCTAICVTAISFTLIADIDSWNIDILNNML